MNIARPIAPRRPPEEERRAHILECAERAFVRYGFHAATMTQVADEAGMSAGNLYRYFPSKEAIVEGLCLADQTQRSESFAALEGAADLKRAMRAALKEHVLGCPPAKAQMIVEIWAESGRNPRVAEFTRQLDRDVIVGLADLFDLAKSRGLAPQGVESRFAARLLYSLVAGLFKRIALEPDFDLEAESAMALGVFEALFAGALTPSAEI
ncbi:MAG: TetR/AcrR family transcriptional regulator [Pseudomonadota bacterium]|nr:TetR/AcrR family transcriptional regulator [Pseudomonadota bacterium]